VIDLPGATRPVLVRAGVAADQPALVRIDVSGDEAFADVGLVLRSQAVTASSPVGADDAGSGTAGEPEETAEIEGDPLLVAEVDGVVAGYAALEPISTWWHLWQISVDPPYARRGVGTALLRHAIGLAVGAGVSGITLTTFRDVPFNAPWYAREGFELVEEHELPWLAEARATERERGSDVAPRVAMALRLPGASAG
jgi:N-acetylglutamate synthase-like GNAT family acetyltransferase